MLSVPELKKLLSNEELLLVMLCRLHFGLADRSSVSFLIEEPATDHSRFMMLVQVHQVRPFIYHILNNFQLSLPPEHMLVLKDFALANHLRSMEQAAITGKIYSRLKEKGIIVLPYKGAAFASQYLGNLCLRESTDIDLLVDKTAVEAVEDDFIKAGYAPKMTVPRAYMPYYKKYFKEIVYSAPANRQKKGYSVEVHWKLVNCYIGTYPDATFFLEGSQEMSHPFHHYEMAAGKAFLAIAANHFIKDMSVKFKYILDVACLLHKDGTAINAMDITALTTKHSCRKKTELGLWLTEMLFGQTMNDYVYRYQFDTRQLKTCLQVPLLVREFDIKNAGFLKHSLRLQDNSRNKLRFLWKCTRYFLLPTTNDINGSVHGNTPIAYLAIKRPFRLVTKLFKEQ